MQNTHGGGGKVILHLPSTSKKRVGLKSILVGYVGCVDYQYFVKICYNACFYNQYKIDLVVLRN